jgi:hypothetical protein
MNTAETGLDLASFTLRARQQAASKVGDNHPGLKGRVQRRIYNAVLDGRLDAERVRGRWYLREDMVPVAADLLLSTAA